MLFVSRLFSFLTIPKPLKQFMLFLKKSSIPLIKSVYNKNFPMAHIIIDYDALDRIGCCT